MKITTVSKEQFARETKHLKPGALVGGIYFNAVGMVCYQMEGSYMRVYRYGYSSNDSLTKIFGDILKIETTRQVIEERNSEKLSKEERYFGVAELFGVVNPFRHRYRVTILEEDPPWGTYPVSSQHHFESEEEAMAFLESHRWTPSGDLVFRHLRLDRFLGIGAGENIAYENLLEMVPE